MKNIKICLCIIGILGIFFSSCSEETTTHTTLPVVDTPTKMSNQDSLLNLPTCGIYHNDSMISKPTGYTSDIELLTAKIIYDDNFAPSYLLKLKLSSTATVNVVAVKIKIEQSKTTDLSPNKRTVDTSCIKFVNRKVTILPNQTAMIIGSLKNSEGCDYNSAIISIEEVVYSSGLKRLGGPSLLYY